MKSIKVPFMRVQVREDETRLHFRTSLGNRAWVPRGMKLAMRREIQVQELVEFMDAAHTRGRKWIRGTVITWFFERRAALHGYVATYTAAPGEHAAQDSLKELLAALRRLK